jgi:membrane-associated protease RseP (regulator of RpoE activity)
MDQFLLSFGHTAIHEIGGVFAHFMILLLWGMLHMVIHEVGHILAAWIVGSKILEVGMSRLGPFVRRTSARTPGRNAFVALAGPGINILSWVVFAAFGLPHAWVALYIGVLNLLPLPNSDFSKSMGYLRGA